MKTTNWIVAAGLGFAALGAQAEVKPFLSIVPRMCGVNTLESVGGPAFVNEVCLSGLAGTSTQVVHVSFTNGDEEAYPIVATKATRTGTTLYAATNQVVRAADGGPVRLGTMSVTQTTDRGIVSLSGRTPRGISFDATLAPVMTTATVGE